MIQGGVRQRLEEMEGVDDIDIALVWEPRWSPQAMSPVARLFFGTEEE
jgi:metal-sulfur cluster biosynthetic enzyme